eukprot:6316480-Prymnesium_polylepis.1
MHVAPIPTRRSVRPYRCTAYIALPLAPSDDAFRRSGRRSLWPLYRGMRAVTSTRAGEGPGGCGLQLASRVGT